MTTLNYTAHVNLFFILLTVTIAGSDTKFRDSTVNYKRFSTEVCSLESPVSCPTWSYCNITRRCQCYQLNRWILCDEKKNVGKIQTCVCLTFNNVSKVTEIGNCLLTCSWDYSLFTNMLYNVLPKNITQLNKIMCEKHSRTGTLCGKCISNTYRQAYSYNMTCVPCNGSWINALKYVVSAFLPLTIFYFLLLFFSFNIHTSKLQGFVLFSQAVSFPIVARTFIPSSRQNNIEFKIFQFIQGFYGIWNLDFFRLFNHSICFKMSSLNVLLLDYLAAVYPFFLIILTYILTVCSGRSCRSISRRCLKPAFLFKKKFMNNWNINHSILDTFITFTILSCLKVSSVCMDLLVPVVTYNIKSKQSRLTLYYDSSISYFSKEHLPYALVGVTMALIFIVFPFFTLIMFPLKAFQSCLNRLPNKWQIVARLVLDSAQGCYKNGTEPGTRDWRWYASMPYLYRFITLIIISMSSNIVVVSYFAIAIPLLTVFNIIVEPYKNNYRHIGTHFIISFLFIGLFTMLEISTFMLQFTNKSHTSFITFPYITFFSLSFMYFLYVIIPCK